MFVMLLLLFRLLLLFIILIVIVNLSVWIFLIPSSWSDDWLSLWIFRNNFDMLSKQLLTCTCSKWSSLRTRRIKLLRTRRFHIHLGVRIICIIMIIILCCLCISLIISRIFKDICSAIILSSKTILAVAATVVNVVVTVWELCLLQLLAWQMIFFFLFLLFILGIVW